MAAGASYFEFLRLLQTDGALVSAESRMMINRIGCSMLLPEYIDLSFAKKL